MSAIVTKIVEKYTLTSKMSDSELSQYTSEFLENLTDDRKRNQDRWRLQDGFKFSSNQVSILIPNQRSGKTKTINIVKGSYRIVIASPPKNLEEEIIREIAKWILQNRYGFSEDQVNALFSIQKNGSSHSVTTSDKGGAFPMTLRVTPTGLLCNKNVNIVVSNKPQKRIEEETIGEMVHQLLRDKLSIQDVRAEAYALALSAPDANASSSRLSQLRRELRNIGVSSQIIEATKFPDITEDANKIQRDNRKKAEANRIDYPDEFTLESVKERLNAYDLKTPPNYQALADVIVMLCIRPAELITLRITDAGVTGYAKNRGQPDIPRKFRSMEKDQEWAKELLTWIQNSISSGRMGNPGKPGVKWFNKFLKDYNLISKYLCKLGAVYAVVTNGAKNMAHTYTIAGEALWHSCDNHTSPVQNYVVVNYRRRGQDPEQTRSFYLYDDDN